MFGGVLKTLLIVSYKVKYFFYYNILQCANKYYIERVGVICGGMLVLFSC